jgi:hypothetical protein
VRQTCEPNERISSFMAAYTPVVWQKRPPYCRFEEDSCSVSWTRLVVMNCFSNDETIPMCCRIQWRIYPPGAMAQIPCEKFLTFFLKTAISIGTNATTCYNIPPIGYKSPPYFQGSATSRYWDRRPWSNSLTFFPCLTAPEAFVFNGSSKIYAVYSCC